ncbi:MAG: hypothetical protein GPJ54_17025 [Candidatus Heimdallarchaeota archaeon]|nr:hypothetical protein [Candidatus Heimdallarchaeota archaeon]
MIEEFDPDLVESTYCPKCNTAMPYAWFTDKDVTYVKFQQKPVEYGKKNTKIRSTNGGVRFKIETFMLRFCPKCERIYKHLSISYLPNGPGIK